VDPLSFIAALVSVICGGAMWKFLEKKIAAGKAAKRIDHETEAVLRDNLIGRVDKLEKLLIESSEEKRAMRIQIQELTVQVTELKVEIRFLRKENNKLRDQLNT